MIRRLHAAAFVGITDEWQSSICLFYKMHGKSGHRTGGAAQLGKTRSQDSAQKLEEADKARETLRAQGLDSDGMDDQIFAVASELFQERAVQYGCYEQAKSGTPNGGQVGKEVRHKEERKRNHENHDKNTKRRSPDGND